MMSNQMPPPGGGATPPGDINRPPCVFAKALLAHCAVCELARRRDDATRESLLCASPVARAACASLHGFLRRNAAFALRADANTAIRPQALLRLQCGGLAGLKLVLAPASHAPDVHRLVRLAGEQAGGLETLPVAEIVKAIAAWPSATPRR